MFQNSTAMLLIISAKIKQIIKKKLSKIKQDNMRILKFGIKQTLAGLL
jgi:hypothetical protein